MSSGHNLLSAADYGVFGAMLFVSIAIGVYYAVSGNRQRSTDEFFMGNRKMTWLPASLSLLVTFESAIFMLGIPAEGYVYGTQMWVGPLGFCLACLAIAAVVVPLLRRLPITSIYQYLELRYKSKALRLVGTVLGILRQLLYMGIVVYGPSLALEAVSGLPLIGSILLVGFGSTIYTSIGGLKAVIWTDVFQSLIMFTGVFAILIQGTIKAGGPAAVWRIAQDGGRLNFFDLRPDPRVRHSFWSLLLGFLVIGIDRGFRQSTVQRVISQRTDTHARRLWLLAAPAFLVTMLLAIYMGTVAYAYYVTQRCDPLASGIIRNPNQVVVLMVAEIFDGQPGMAGIFLSALVGASLSTLSSILSSVSVNIWEDLLKPHLGHLSDYKAAIIAKVTVVLLGALACGIALLISFVGGTLTQIAMSLLTAFAAPTAGLFLLSCLFPWANKWGALAGTAAGLLVSCFLSFGSSFPKAKVVTPWLPPAPTDGCLPPSGNVTMADDNVTGFAVAPSAEISDVINVTMATSGFPGASPELEGMDKIFEMSYLLFGPVTVIILLIVGNLVSVATGGNKKDPVDPKYLIQLWGCFSANLSTKSHRLLQKDVMQEEDADFKNGSPSAELVTKSVENGTEEYDSHYISHDSQLSFQASTV